MRTFHVTVPEADAEIAADRLWQLGVEAVGLHDPIDGHVELWTSVGASDESLARAVAALDPGWSWQTKPVVAAAETWRDHVEATWYDNDAVVVPAWQLDDVDVRDGVLVTAIEPATSFGLGDHPTTALSLTLLSDHLREHDVASLLDVGCGSGVLGIVAAQRGVETIRAVDISSGAIEATASNAALNGVADRIEVDRASLGEIVGPFDVVVANILAPTLIALADELKRLTSSRGTLIISGILDDAHDHVLAALSPFHVVDARANDGWISIRLAPEPG